MVQMMRVKKTYICKPLSPESVYSFNMVLLDPPAPAARVELGLGAVGALRLMVKTLMSCRSIEEAFGSQRLEQQTQPSRQNDSSRLTGQHWHRGVERPQRKRPTCRMEKLLVRYQTISEWPQVQTDGVRSVRDSTY